MPDVQERRKFFTETPLKAMSATRRNQYRNSFSILIRFCIDWDPTDQNGRYLEPIVTTAASRGIWPHQDLRFFDRAFMKDTFVVPATPIIFAGGCDYYPSANHVLEVEDGQGG